MKNTSQLIRWINLALVVASVVRELRKPASERTWHGLVAGFVPYDWRVPTVERLRAAWFNPENRQILTPTPFGVGWTLNPYPLIEQVRVVMGMATGGDEPW